MPYELQGPKWTGRTELTWSFADFDLEAGLAEQFRNYPDFTASIGGEFRELIRVAFATWDAFTNLDFREVSDTASSDIRLGEIYIDGRPASGQSTTLGVAHTWWSDNSYRKASISFDVDAFDSSSRFFWTALHEIGHALGLGHSDSPSDMMYGFLNSQNQQGASADDVAGVQALYGAEPGYTVRIGTAGADQVTGNSGGDLIYAYSGADTVIAGDGNNTVVGGAGSVDGADLITSGTGQDLIFGNGGADTVQSGSGHDIVIGGHGMDSLILGDGDDVAFANQDADWISAGAGRDVIYAGFGSDTVFAGSGDDEIWGHEGNDLLLGEAGADRFVFQASSGADQITGFTASEGDRVDLQGQTYTSMASADGDLILALSGGGSVELNGISHTGSVLFV